VLGQDRAPRRVLPRPPGTQRLPVRFPRSRVHTRQMEKCGHGRAATPANTRLPHNGWYATALLAVKK